MPPRQIVTGRKLVLSSYPPGVCVYTGKGGTINSIDNMGTFDVLYLYLNYEEGEHFVYNIDTMERSSESFWNQQAPYSDDQSYD